MSEFQQRSVDQEVMQLALSQERILLSKDKDSGRLVYTAQADSPGMILIRFRASARGMPGTTIRRLIREHAGELEHAFVVLQPGLLRISRKADRAH